MTEEIKITRDIALPMGRNAKGNMLLARIQGTDDIPVRGMLGELQPLDEGVPIRGEVVQLTPGDNPPYLNVETMMADPKESDRVYSIPSKQYQENWERIFGKNTPSAEMN